MNIMWGAFSAPVIEANIYSLVLDRYENEALTLRIVLLFFFHMTDLYYTLSFCLKSFGMQVISCVGTVD